MFLHEHPLIRSIAETNNISTAQVVLSWANQRGIVVIPKSENEERIKQNQHVCGYTRTIFLTLIVRFLAPSTLG